MLKNTENIAKKEKNMKKLNKINGTIGEIDAVQFLKNKKYQIIATNYRNRMGEIDIIAKDKNALVFVEVKSRATLLYGRPCEAVDFRKQQKIRKVAELYLVTTKNYYADVRFDVIEILGDEINHIENAF